MTSIPSARTIPDPETEVRRLAGERGDPPWREWAIRHPGGKVTVRIDGHPFLSRTAADTECGRNDLECGECDGGPHTLLCRDRQPWRAP